MRIRASSTHTTLNSHQSIKDKDGVIHSLFITSNYYDQLNVPFSKVVSQLFELALLYCELARSSLATVGPLGKQLFIINRGLDTLLHIFVYLLCTTRNLPLTKYHCQKAYHLYIEYIEQINRGDRDVLNLHSRDAVLYVYRKTIYDVLSEKARKSTWEFADLLNEYVQFIRTLFYFVSSHGATADMKKIEMLGDYLVEWSHQADVSIIRDLNDVAEEIIADGSDFHECLDMIYGTLYVDN